MARRKSKHPTELELLILQVLWDRSPLPVREVRVALEERDRPLAHTSLITTLNVMVDKGYVARKPAGRGYEFSPSVTRDEVSQGMVGDLVERLFEGSSKSLLLSLLDHQHLSAAERDELAAAIANHKKEHSKNDK